MGFSYINQRNRDRNIKETERALKDEIEEMKNAKADPFTRRNCIPTLVTKLTDVDQKAVIRQRVEDQYAMELPEDADLRKVRLGILCCWMSYINDCSRVVPLLYPRG